MYFFFTFPLWPILAMLVFAIVGAGVVVEWITNHILVISLIIWLITFIFATLLTAKGKKLCTISIVSLFIAPYIALISCFFDVVRALNKGDLFHCNLFIWHFGWYIISTACIWHLLG